MLIKDTKVYAVLSKFDKYEQNRCRKYIQSPYFNANENLITLYGIIISDINKSNKKTLTKEIVWKNLHNHKKYDDARLRKYTSDLLKLVEGYLAQQFYERNPLRSVTDFMKAVDEKKISELYKSSIRNAKHIAEKKTSLSSEYFLNKYRIEDYTYSILDFDLKRDEKSNFELIMSNLDQFYFGEKLRQYCNILSRKRMSSYEYDVQFTEEVIDYVRDNIENVSLNVEIYYRIYNTHIQTSDPQNYEKLKTLLKDHSSKFPQEEAYHIYLQVINYCTKKIREGNNSFLSEMFELYKGMIENMVIYENGIILPSIFKNIITLATALREFEWAENFINSNKENLPKDQQENMVSFNLARLHFTQKNHAKVIELLREVEYSDIYLGLQAKSILLMTYFDIDEFEPLDSLLESFRVYLNRHKEIPLSQKNYYKNLIKFTKKLTKVIPGDKAVLAKIKQEIEETEGFRVKWLEEKIAELES